MSLYHLQIGLFVLLLIAEFYLFARLFSCVDQQRFGKVKWLGPFAFLVPGVLSQPGIKTLIAVGFVTAGLVLLSLGLFDTGDLLLRPES